MDIKEKILLLKAEVNADILAASKGRSIEEIHQAIEAGIVLFGENYVQEAGRKFNSLQEKIELHLIGHLQSNKVKAAAKIFDMIQTVDSDKIALLIDAECRKIGKVMPVLIEVNIGREKNKTGCMPEDVFSLAEKIHSLKNLRLRGIMVMGPAVEAEKLRPFYREGKRIFDSLKEKYGIAILSMGMSDSYEIAIEEGATMVRIGRVIFG